MKSQSMNDKNLNQLLHDMHGVGTKQTLDEVRSTGEVMNYKLYKRGRLDKCLVNLRHYKLTFVIIHGSLCPSFVLILYIFF